MQPRVSIIIPVYNGEKYIRNSIIKLQMQTYANLEVIYVDDGSTDQTGIILDETATEDDRFRVIHKEKICPAIQKRLSGNDTLMPNRTQGNLWI